MKPGQLVRLVSVNYALSENIPTALVPYCATGSTAKEGTSDEMSLARNGMALGKWQRKKHSKFSNIPIKD